MDMINELKDKYSENFTAEKDEIDYMMKEAEIKFMLTEEYEKEKIMENIENYNFNKILKHQPLKFDEIYAIKENDDDNEEGEKKENAKAELVSDGEVEWIYYGRAKAIHRKTHLEFESFSNFSADGKTDDVFIAISLHKKIPEVIKKIDNQLVESIGRNKFEEVNSSRKIKDKLWMEYNYIYLFSHSGVRNDKKIKDEIFPYMYLIDPFAFENIECLNCNKPVVQFYNKDKDCVQFAFDQILEAYRFYKFAIKARENMREIYHIGAHTIRVNVDICLNFSEKLVFLRKMFSNLAREIYDGIRLKENESRLKKFSEELHRYMVGFNCKPTIEHKYLAIFLEQYQAYYYDKMLELLNEANDNDDLEEKEEEILSLINNCKFHEEFLRKWKIVDRRINNTTKV